MEHEGDRRHHCHDHDLALGLQELGYGEVEAVGEELRDHVQGEPPGELRDIRVLLEQTKDGRREQVDRQEAGARGEKDDPGPLHVDAKHVELLRAIGLAAQCLQGASHAHLVELKDVKSPFQRRSIWHCKRRRSQAKGTMPSALQVQNSYVISVSAGLYSEREGRGGDRKFLQ